MPLAKPPAKPPSFDTLLKDLAQEETAEPAPPEPAKTEKAEEEVPFDAILAGLTGEEDQSTAEAKTQARLTGLLRQTITDAIKQKVERKWNVPAGVRDAGELVVTLRIRLQRDGSAKWVEIVDDGSGGANYRTMAESARRAVLAASPLRRLEASWRQPRPLERYRDDLQAAGVSYPPWIGPAETKEATVRR